VTPLTAEACETILSHLEAAARETRNLAEHVIDPGPAAKYEVPWAFTRALWVHPTFSAFDVRLISYGRSRQGRRVLGLRYECIDASLRPWERSQYFDDREQALRFLAGEPLPSLPEPGPRPDPFEAVLKAQEEMVGSDGSASGFGAKKAARMRRRNREQERQTWR
jgi:hypothetical protein